MNVRNLRLLALVLTLAVGQSFAVDCPTHLFHKNGNYLKSGANYYYSNGNYLVSGINLYHANGNYFKNGTNYFYPNGNYLRSGTNLYYPNGNYLKSGSNFYYPNGNYLQSGANFYYENGNYARSGTTLYQPDGVPTAFPLSLQAAIGSFGEFRVRVTSHSQDYAYWFQNLLSDAAVTLVNFSPLDNQFGVRIHNGYPNQYVQLTVDANGGVTACALEDASQPDPEFTLVAGAATVNVKVNPGYDVNKVRNALLQTLQNLR